MGGGFGWNSTRPETRGLGGFGHTSLCACAGTLRMTLLRTALRKVCGNLPLQYKAPNGTCYSIGIPFVVLVVGGGCLSLKDVVCPMPCLCHAYASYSRGVQTCINACTDVP